MTVEPLTPEIARRLQLARRIEGVVIREVAPGSRAAAAAGLRTWRRHRSGQRPGREDAGRAQSGAGRGGGQAGAASCRAAGHGSLRHDQEQLVTLFPPPSTGASSLWARRFFLTALLSLLRSSAAFRLIERLHEAGVPPPLRAPAAQLGGARNRQPTRRDTAGCSSPRRRVDGGDDLRQQRHLVAAKAVGIAGAVQPLVVVTNDRRTSRSDRRSPNSRSPITGCCLIN